MSKCRVLFWIALGRVHEGGAGQKLYPDIVQWQGLCNPIASERILIIQVLTVTFLSSVRRNNGMQDRSFEKLFTRISAENPAALLMPGKDTRGPFVAPRERKRGAMEKPLRNRVLLVGNHRELTLYRAEVLRHIGFQVQTPEDKQATLAIIARGNFDVAVLSYTLSNTTVQELADSIREHCPKCPVVAIAESKRFDRRIAPDAIALVAEGPPGLISALEKVLQQR